MKEKEKKKLPKTMSGSREAFQRRPRILQLRKRRAMPVPLKGKFSSLSPSLSRVCGVNNYACSCSEFIASQQRAKIVRLEETVQSLHNKLREAIRAKSQAERNLAFQILENDRQKNRLERLKVHYC